MVIIRVEPTAAAAAVERTRLYLASLGESLGLLSGPSVAEMEKAQAWCVRGRAVGKRIVGASGRMDNRFLARQ